jgi:hypothetical protein
LFAKRREEEEEEEGQNYIMDGEGFEFKDEEGMIRYESLSMQCLKL